MIAVEELLYDFRLSFNKIEREDNQVVPVEDIVLFLNRAQIFWVESRISPNNPLKTGYEETIKRIDDLQSLKVEFAPITLVGITDSLYKGYSAALDSSLKYMKYISSYIRAKKGDCAAELVVDLVRQNDLSTLYFDTNFAPSFEWRKTLATLGNDKLTVYTDGKFVPEVLYLTYLRYPKAIDIEGYVKVNGQASVRQDCELPYYAKSDLVDLAVKFASHSTENQLQSQAAENRIQLNSE